MKVDSGVMCPNFWRALNAAQDKVADLCDFVIVCGDREWAVHKFVLRLHDGPLAAACKGEWKEAQEGRIDLSSDPVAAVNALVQYLYRFVYDVEEAESDGEVEFHTQVAIIADKYGLTHLKSRAEDKFADALGELDFANDDLANALHLAYTVPEPTATIRKRILEHAVDKKDFLTNEKIESSKFADLIFGNATIASDLAKAAMAQYQTWKEKSAKLEKQRLKCTTCHRTFVTDIETLRAHQQGNSWMRCPDGQCDSRKQRVAEWTTR